MDQNSENSENIDNDNDSIKITKNIVGAKYTVVHGKDIQHRSD